MEKLLEQTMENVSLLNYQEQVDFFNKFKSNLIESRDRTLECLYSERKVLEERIDAVKMGTDTIQNGNQILTKQGY